MGGRVSAVVRVEKCWLGEKGEGYEMGDQFDLSDWGVKGSGDGHRQQVTSWLMFG